MRTTTLRALAALLRLSVNTGRVLDGPAAGSVTAGADGAVRLGR